MCLGLARDLARAWTRSVGDSVVVFFLLTPSSPPSLSSVRLISVLFVKRICLTHSDVAQIITLSAGGHIDTVKRSQWTDVHYELDTIDRANISVIGFDFFFFFADSENQRKKPGPYTYIRITWVDWCMTIWEYIIWQTRFWTVAHYMEIPRKMQACTSALGFWRPPFIDY